MTDPSMGLAPGAGPQDPITSVDRGADQVDRDSLVAKILGQRLTFMRHCSWRISADVSDAQYTMLIALYVVLH